MKFSITKACHLLSKKALEALGANDLKEYYKAVAEFVAAFNARYPNGKEVEVDITGINLTPSNGDRPAIYVAHCDDLSTQVFTYPENVLDAMARNAKSTDGFTLEQLILGTTEPCKLTITVKAVNVDDEYTTTQGEVRKYQIPAMAKVPGTQEHIILSDEVMEVLKEMRVAIANQHILASAKKNQRKVVATPPPVEEPVV